MLDRLADPRLTGTTSTELARLAVDLAPAQAARTQQRYAEQRHGRARRATGSPRSKPVFDDAARVLITVVYQPAAGLLHERLGRLAEGHCHLHRRPGETDS